MTMRLALKHIFDNIHTVRFRLYFGICSMPLTTGLCFHPVPLFLASPFPADSVNDFTRACLQSSRYRAHQQR